MDKSNIVKRNVKNKGNAKTQTASMAEIENKPEKKNEGQTVEGAEKSVVAKIKSVNSSTTVGRILINHKHAFIIGLFIGVFVLRSPVVISTLKFMMRKYRGYEYDAEYDCIVEGIDLEGEPMGCRPTSDCTYCTNVSKIDIIDVKELSMGEFAKYAYSGRPLLVKNAAKKWKALESLNFQFFRDLNEEFAYTPFDVDHCQIFRWKSKEKHNFQDLQEVFDMSKKQWTLQGNYKPWYVGWRVCHQKASEVLQKFYDSPSFMPKDWKLNKTEWIFMGTPGVGAPFHLDNVEASSWQAQIHGKKKWILKTVPECYWICNQGEEMSVTMETGDIFIINTNLWYHSTIVLEDELSITMTIEYKIPQLEMK